MKKNLAASAAIAVMALTSCYVTVRENHPHPRARVIIQTSANSIPKDSLQMPAVNNINPKDSLQVPAK